MGHHVLYFMFFASLLFSVDSVSSMKDLRYYCAGECGVVRQRCSCKPSCQSDRNCCTDYEETCNGGKSWKDTQCSTAEQMSCPTGYKNFPPVVVLSIDGYRDIYFNRNYTPTIKKMASCGVKTPYMRSAYPTKTFPNHYTIATGLYTESHGIISNTIYDHERELKFRPGRKASFSPHWWGGQPIWVTASDQGLKSATYFWPGGEINITRYPDYYLSYNQSTPLEERVYKLFDWLDMPEDKRPSIIMLYNHVVDSAGHKYGPFGSGLNDALMQSDEMVEMIMNGLRDRKLDTCVNFIITSDHGMAPVDCTNKLKYLDDYGLNLTEITFDASAFVRIGPSMDKSLADKYNSTKIMEKLECKRETAHWEAFMKQGLPKRYHYANNKWIEDVHLVVDDEWWVGVKDDPDCDPGGHGYDPTYTDMRAFFTAHGIAFKRGYERSEPFDSIELYNLFTDLLGLIPAPNNGTAGSLYDIMKMAPVLQNDSKRTSSVSCPLSLSMLGSVESICPECPIGSPQDITAAIQANKKNFDSEEVKKYQVTNSPFGNPEILKDTKYCILTQKDYISAFDQGLKMPLMSSFVLNGGNKSQIQQNSSFCTQRDIRVDTVKTFSCSLMDDVHSEVVWTYLFSPAFVKKSEVYQSAVSSNIVPVYKPFAEVWKFITQLLMKWVDDHGEIAVQVGPVFDYDYDGHADTKEVLKNGVYADRGSEFTVPIPTHFFIVASRCKGGGRNDSINECAKSLKNVELLNFVIPNYKESPCHKAGKLMKEWLPEVLSRHVARIKDIELLTGISFLTKWTSTNSTQNDRLVGIRKKLVLPDVTDKWMKDFLNQDGESSTTEATMSTTTPSSTTSAATRRDFSAIFVGTFFLFSSFLCT